MDNTDDELVITGSPIETVQTSFQPFTNNLSSSSSTPIIISTSTISLSDAVPVVITRSPIETDKPSFKPDTDTLSSSSSTPITASISEISPSDAVHYALIKFCASYISVNRNT